MRRLSQYWYGQGGVRVTPHAGLPRCRWVCHGHSGWRYGSLWRGVGEPRCRRWAGGGRRHQEGQKDIAGGLDRRGKLYIKRFVLVRLGKQHVKDNGPGPSFVQGPRDIALQVTVPPPAAK